VTLCIFCFDIVNIVCWFVLFCFVFRRLIYSIRGAHRATSSPRQSLGAHGRTRQVAAAMADRAGHPAPTAPRPLLGCPATCHAPTCRPDTCHVPTGRPATCHVPTGRPATCPARHLPPAVRRSAGRRSPPSTRARRVARTPSHRPACRHARGGSRSSPGFRV
jgi:hypothetical protein